MDDFIPPVIRDSRWFMYPFFWYWFKGKDVDLYMDFKKIAPTLSPKQFHDVYAALDCRATDRKTDLNDACLDFMLKNLAADATTLLDVGCGRGYWLELLKEKTALQLTGCDVFDNSPLDGISYVKGYIEKLPFADNAFDIVTCHHTIEHIPALEKAITELKRITKKQLIIVTPKQRYYFYTLDLHLHFFPLEEQLTQLVNMENSICKNCNGDWCYIGSK